MEIFKDFGFEAAHLLPYVPDGHKCKRLHGHSFRVRVVVEGDLRQREGWVMDFGDISEVVNPIIRVLDHHYLNEIVGLENPTSENIACWLWNRIKIPGLVEIEVRETCTSGARYRGP